MKKLLQGRDAKALAQLLDLLQKPTKESPYPKYMPLLVGKPDEIADLAVYLETLSLPKQGHVVTAKP